MPVQTLDQYAQSLGLDRIEARQAIRKEAKSKLEWRIREAARAARLYPNFDNRSRLEAFVKEWEDEYGE